MIVPLPCTVQAIANESRGRFWPTYTYESKEPLIFSPGMNEFLRFQQMHRLTCAPEQKMP